MDTITTATAALESTLVAHKLDAWVRDVRSSPCAACVALWQHVVNDDDLLNPHALGAEQHERIQQTAHAVASAVTALANALGIAAEVGCD